MANGIVYVFSNPAMPGIVKIGMTTKDQIDDRLKELFTTSVPVPFECEYACKVKDCQKVENALHIAFDPDRVNPQREFFRIEPERAIAVLSLVSEENITTTVNSSVQSVLSKIDIDAGIKLKKSRRPSINFIELGINIGEKIKFIDDQLDIEAEIISEKIVKYKDKEYSLTGLTKELLGIDYAVQPTNKWTYKGRNLKDIYEEKYPLE
jgi:hypothetical protein